MTKLEWGASGQKRHDTGLDRGVLYVNSTGYAWNGLLSVEERFVGGDVESYYQDGVKYQHTVGAETFEATIESVTVPSGMINTAGGLEVAPGLVSMMQDHKSFNFSYRTLMSNDWGTEFYKIYIIYNAIAVTIPAKHTTIVDGVELETYTWEISTIPQAFTGGWYGSYNKSAYFVVNSERADPTKLAALEDTLYGTASTNPSCPTPTQLVTALY